MTDEMYDLLSGEINELRKRIDELKKELREVIETIKDYHPQMWERLNKVIKRLEGEKESFRHDHEKIAHETNIGKETSLRNGDSKPAGCFMGNCIHLDPNDDDFCRDYEAQSGKWGKCYEFKEKPAEHLYTLNELHRDGWVTPEAFKIEKDRQIREFAEEIEYILHHSYDHELRSNFKNLLRYYRL